MLHARRLQAYSIFSSRRTPANGQAGARPVHCLSRPARHEHALGGQPDGVSPVSAYRASAEGTLAFKQPERIRCCWQLMPCRGLTRPTATSACNLGFNHPRRNLVAPCQRASTHIRSFRSLARKECPPRAGFGLDGGATADRVGPDKAGTTWVRAGRRGTSGAKNGGLAGLLVPWPVVRRNQAGRGGVGGPSGGRTGVFAWGPELAGTANLFGRAWARRTRPSPGGRRACR